MSKGAAARRKRNHQHSGQHSTNTRTTQPASTNSRPKTQAPARRVHGPWLTAILVWIALDGLLAAVLLFAYHREMTAQEYPLLMGAAVLVALATIGSAVAMWYWKRWGLYLFLAATAGSVALGIIALPAAAMIVAFHAIIPLALLGYVLTYQKKMPLLT